MEEKDKKYKQSIFTIGVTFKKLSLCIYMYIILQFSECFLDLFLITIGEELRKKTNPKCYKF